MAPTAIPMEVTNKNRKKKARQLTAREGLSPHCEKQDRRGRNHQQRKKKKLKTAAGRNRRRLRTDRRREDEIEMNVNQ